MTAKQVAHIGDLYLNWQEEADTSLVVKQAEVVRNDYNLSPAAMWRARRGAAPAPGGCAGAARRKAGRGRREIGPVLATGIRGLSSTRQKT